MSYKCSCGKEFASPEERIVHTTTCVDQARIEERKRIGEILQDKLDNFFIRVNVGYDKPDYQYTIDPSSLSETIKSLKQGKLPEEYRP